MHAACLRPTSPNKSNHQAFHFAIYWLLDVPESAHQKKQNKKKTHRQLKIRGQQLLSEYTSLPHLPRSPFSSLPQHIDPSVRQSDDLTLEGQVLKPRGLDHDGNGWTPKRDFDSAMSWNDANWSQPLFISTCQSLQFFEEKIAGA